MKKIDNFSNCLDVLKTANYDFKNMEPIYRTGIIAQFNLCFELAWKAMQEVLKMHGAYLQTGSPREILKCGYKYGFINDEAVWLDMLNKRNTSVNLYNEEAINEMLILIRDSFTPALTETENTLRRKYDEANSGTLS